MNATTTIGKIIKRYRLAKNLTQQQCTEALGFENRSTYHRLETGRIRWRLDEFILIAKLLEIEPARLLEEWKSAMKRES